jgi:glycosyltransferase involved in cell wall biosynthesis
MMVNESVTGGPGAGPDFAVIVPHYNDLRNLGICLDLLAQQDFSRPFEIVIVDNASPLDWRSIEAVVRDRAKLILCREKGAGPARNAGVAATQAERLAFIDSDCRAAPGWLTAGFAALDAFDFIGGRVDVDVEDPSLPTPVEAFETVFAFRFEHYIKKKRFTGTGNLFARRAVFDAIGGFLPQVSEDVEWSHRALAAGFRLGYEPKAVVSHPARRDWAELKRKWERVNLEAYALAKRRRGGVLRFVLRSWLVLLSILPHTATILRDRRLRRWQDRLGAVGVLARIRTFRFVAAHLAALGLAR